MLKCPNCGAEYNDNTWFCVNCGTMLDVERDKIVEHPEPVEEESEAVEEAVQEEPVEEPETVEEEPAEEEPVEEELEAVEEEPEAVEEEPTEEEPEAVEEEPAEEEPVEEEPEAVEEEPAEEEPEAVEEEPAEEEPEPVEEEPAEEEPAEEEPEAVEAEIVEPAPVVPRMPGAETEADESDRQAYSSYAGGSDNTDYDIETSPVHTYNYEDDPAARDKGSIGWAILGFFVPLVGIILFIAWHKSKPNSARNAGAGALVSIIVNFVLTIIGFIILGIGASFFALAPGMEDISDIASSVVSNLTR